MTNKIIAEDKVVLERFQYGGVDVTKDATISTNTKTGTKHITLYYHFRDGDKPASSALIILNDEEFGKMATVMGYEKKGDR